VRKVAFLLLVAAAGVGGTAYAETKPASRNAGQKVSLERVVAIVNDSIILQSELDARLTPMIAQAQAIPDEGERKRRLAKLSSQILDEMVNEELIVQAAVASKIEVETSEVQAALDEIKQQNNLDDAGLAQALSAQGYTLPNYKADLRRQLMRLRAVNTIVQPKIQITDEDIKARYDQMQRRSEAVSAVRLSDILIKLPDHATEQQINEGKAKAGKAVERVKGGEDFVAVAKDMSDDASTKDTGGELGWFERGSINPDWEQVVFSMEKGDTRGPISGPQGLYVFQVTDVKKSELKPFAEMKEQLTRELKRRELDKQTEIWVQELRKKAYIDIKLQ
jgi:peptidyl-prolyl cis-trans isomerase SurA